MKGKKGTEILTNIKKKIYRRGPKINPSKSLFGGCVRQGVGM